MISIIVPVLNEEKTIEGLLLELKALEGDKEIIVVDGGSVDRTAEIAARHAVFISGVSGRARQMNRGAVAAKERCFGLCTQTPKLTEKASTIYKRQSMRVA